MKKLLVATLLASTCGLASAQATVYGLLDAGYSDISKKVAGVKQSTQAIDFNGFNSSRFGITAGEDLGGGNKVSVKIETAISSNMMAGYSQTGAAAASAKGTTIDATTVGGRELNATLSFANGSYAKAGYGSTGVRDTVLGYAAAGGPNAVGNTLTNDGTLGSNRASSVELGQTFGAVKAFASVSRNNNYADNKADVANGSGYEVGATYASGKLTTTAVRSVSRQGTLTGSSLSADVRTAISIVGAKYDLGFARVLAEGARIQTNDRSASNAVGEGSRQGVSVGVEVPYGKFTPFASYSTGTKQEATVAGTAGIKRNNTGYQVGTKYDLSKRTFAYAVTGETKLDSAAGSTNSEVKVQQVALGLVHAF